MNKLKTLALSLLVCCTYYGCVSPVGQEYKSLPPGNWRGVLYLDDQSRILPSDKDQIETINNSEGELPFNFEVVYDSPEKFHIVLKNGKERILVDDIYFGRDKATAKDTLKIRFKEFDSYIDAIFEERIMEGFWHVNYKNNYKIRFKAFHGDSIRFFQMSNEKPMDFSGRWATTFSKGTEDEYPAIGVFEQRGNELTGTFMTETGDYRYLQGNVAHNKAWLSCFDGAHAYLFEAKINADKSMIGQYRSGLTFIEPFEGVRDENVKLKDATLLTTVKKGNTKFIVNHPNENGEIINSSEGKYKGKVKIIEIMGTWCPNCKDATTYLRELLTKNDSIEVISMAFERYRDKDKSLTQLKRYKEKSGLPFEIVLGGYYDKKDASLQLPQIEKLVSYPTLIIVDRNDNIVKIFTGFYGPATPEYKNFIHDIEETINML